MPAISSTNPRSCLRGKGLHHRADVNPTHHCIGFDRSDQKKPFFTHSHCSSPRVSGQTDSVVSLHDVQRSGHGRLAASNVTKLALLLATYSWSWWSQPALTADDRNDHRGSANGRTRMAEPIFEENWWSQTGSNRRHPACKAGALPAELWPHTDCPVHAIRA
jgi:hypothetical protein